MTIRKVLTRLILVLAVLFPALYGIGVWLYGREMGRSVTPGFSFGAGAAAGITLISFIGLLWVLHRGFQFAYGAMIVGFFLRLLVLIICLFAGIGETQDVAVGYLLFYLTTMAVELTMLTPLLNKKEFT